MKINYLLLITFLIATFTYSQNDAVKTKVDINKVEQDFEGLLNNIKNYYPYLDEEIINLDCIKKQYTNQIKDLKTSDDVKLFFEFVLNEFHDNHFTLNTNTNTSYRLSAPIYVSIKNNKVIIENVWTTNANNLKINILKAEVLSFNNVDFLKAIQDFPMKCAAKNNPKVKEWIANKIIFGRYHQPRILKLKLQDDSIFTLDLDKITLKKTSTLLSTKIIDHIGIITIHNSLGNNNLIAAFDNALDTLSDTKGIILDIRNTVSGGNTYVAKGIMSRFVSEEKPYQKHALFESYNNQPKIKRSFVEYVTPRSKTYKKPLVVLVGRWTGSMGEGLTIGLDGLQRAAIVGTEMRKLLGAVYTVPFKNFSFAYNMPAEKLYHINGIPREEFVPQNYINQIQIDNDQFLQEAFKILKKRL